MATVVRKRKLLVPSFSSVFCHAYRSSDTSMQAKPRISGIVSPPMAIACFTHIHDRILRMLIEFVTTFGPAFLMKFFNASI